MKGWGFELRAAVGMKKREGESGSILETEQ